MSKHEELKSQGSAAAVLAQSGPPTNGEAPRTGRANLKNWLSWAEHHVSGEYPPFAAQAAAVLHRAGGPVTVGGVRARLKASGRDRKSLEREIAA